MIRKAHYYRDKERKERKGSNETVESLNKIKKTGLFMIFYATIEIKAVFKASN